MTKKVWFRFGIGLLLTFLIIKYFLEINHIFYPVIVIVKSIIIPLLLGGFLYYITVPFQDKLESRFRLKRWQSLSVIMLSLVLLTGIFFSSIGPIIMKQGTNFVDNFPTIQKEFQSYVNIALDQREKLPDNVKDGINSGIKKVNDYSGKIVSNAFSFVTQFISTLFLLILVPFFLIYMLKDHDRFIPFVAAPFSGQRKVFVVNLFKDIDRTLKSYIQGQVTVSIILGTLLLIGYLIIGLDYAVILALWGMITNLIPFLGPYLAVIPAIIIALIQDPIMALYVIIIMFIAQQLEGNVITPNIMGKSLNMHPLTIITVILAAGNLGGFMAILVAVPTYAVVKTIVRNVYMHRQDITSEAVKTVTEKEDVEKRNLTR
ncbi:AI-2E family transporter [Macrococcoides caseolyticum]|uniref:AI-2E family transporter n=1 Tax=Macrococcoides caseolyticum TaxID=69966 RepID=UPI001F2547C8|nr:AI-2E family transporter [Macrococcus caseolyticus]MCE4955713.1 AI-2E family transporter [Macrococcus caseolyticus]